MDSNRTLRFPRTYREATGQDCEFPRFDMDRAVFWAVVLAVVFVAGVMVGAA